jgi:hemolysin-activating ACP:hemolysin acyltransferase
MAQSHQPQAPVVIASSTDLGYVTYLMAQVSPYSAWSTDRVMAMAQPALKHRQLRVYCDQSGAPVAFAAWAFVDDATHARFLSGDFDLDDEAWCSGTHLWILHLAAPFGQLHILAADLRDNVFDDVEAVHWPRYTVDGAVGRIVSLRRAPRRRGPSDPLSASEIYDAIWGQDRTVGCFEDTDRDPREAVRERPDDDLHERVEVAREADEDRREPGPEPPGGGCSTGRRGRSPTGTPRG